MEAFEWTDAPRPAQQPRKRLSDDTAFAPLSQLDSGQFKCYLRALIPLSGGSSPSRDEAARSWSGDYCGDYCASRVFAAAWRDDTRTLASGLACRSVRDGHYGHLCM
ncbi:hypothetical protein EMIHUDRAFT_228648 [Emiliania huxleyi CCMP1516]|uniref:Uncharacterized protein n=2 Tax=Emiliania huxleyi TaxID=2903 RepID=A0A0D3KFC9_EMIH1|nr:hypothetical protein EMIHUDRAFT_228648 [Emiliania huxleyi CCMP1516]EOD34464.1 hypothetical protein EMIHUDRAFT_228648 [Emiliania huxleyi CCMP1516]|eukprot:XP_005786893.1 hypothetical protein EMIHUDRAFT_228648 [Emiliania huxleyi CCMP1516]